MLTFLYQFLIWASVYANSGSDHTHTHGEIEHLYPALGIFIVLAIVGTVVGLRKK